MRFSVLNDLKKKMPGSCRDPALTGNRKESNRFITSHDVQAQVKNIKEVAFLNSVPSSQGLTGRDPWEHDTQVTVSMQE